MSAWPPHFMTIEAALWQAVELVASGLGLKREFDQVMAVHKSLEHVFPFRHPLDIDAHLAAYRRGGSRRMATVLADFGGPETETPVALTADDMFRTFISEEPGFFIYKNDTRLVVDESVLKLSDEIPLEEDGEPILVNRRKWNDFREKYRRTHALVTTERLVDMVGALGGPGKRVTKARACAACKAHVSENFFNRHVWPKATRKFPLWCGVPGRSRKR